MFDLFLVILLVAANGFFVASEFALVSVRPSRVDELVADGSRRARSVKRAVRELDRYIAGTQIGITISSLALGWLGEPAIAHILEPLLLKSGLVQSETVLHSVAFVISFSIITMLHVVLGELVPKSLALQKPEKVSLVIAQPMHISVIFFQPLITFLNGLGNLILRLIGMEAVSEHHGVHSPEEIQILVRQSHQAGMLDDAERKIIQRTFRFSELTAGEIMTPRPDMTVLDLSEPEEDLWPVITSSKHTRFPVHEGSVDNITGVLNLKDIVRNLKSGAEKPLKEIIQPVLTVPEQVHVGQLLDEFQKQAVQVAVVVDEHGSTSGLVTLQDIVEEVFGELQESSSGRQTRFEKKEDGSISLSGDVRLNEIEEECGLRIRDETVDTISGLIMKHLGRVAQPGDRIELEKASVVVDKMAKRRILRVTLIPNTPR